MGKFRWFVMAAYSLIAIGCATQIRARASSPPAEIGEAVSGYSKWKAANKDLYLVHRDIWVLCRPPTKEEQARLQDKSHGGWVRVYVNKVGEKAMFSAQAFPVGSIIVKERHEMELGPVQSCTVMRKREAGYNPACGDWEFAILDAKNRVEKEGRLENCVKCHVDQKSLDYTFRSYLKK